LPVKFGHVLAPRRRARGLAGIIAQALGAGQCWPGGGGEREAARTHLVSSWVEEFVGRLPGARVVGHGGGPPSRPGSSREASGPSSLRFGPLAWRPAVTGGGSDAGLARGRAPTRCTAPRRPPPLQLSKRPATSLNSEHTCWPLLAR